MITLSRAIKSEYKSICALSDESSDSLQSHNVLNNYLEKSSILSLKEKGSIVGFLIEQLIADEAELIQITIGTSFRNRGIAYTAMKYWHNQLFTSGVKAVFLEVREDNLPAKYLYEKLHYETIGRRKNYYKVNGQCHDAILMKACL